MINLKFQENFWNIKESLKIIFYFKLKNKKKVAVSTDESGWRSSSIFTILTGGDPGGDSVSTSDCESFLMTTSSFRDGFLTTISSFCDGRLTTWRRLSRRTRRSSEDFEAEGSTRFFISKKIDKYILLISEICRFIGFGFQRRTIIEIGKMTGNPELSKTETGF